MPELLFLLWPLGEGYINFEVKFRLYVQIHPPGQIAKSRVLISHQRLRQLIWSSVWVVEFSSYDFICSFNNEDWAQQRLVEQRFNLLPQDSSHAEKSSLGQAWWLITCTADPRRPQTKLGTSYEQNGSVWDACRLRTWAGLGGTFGGVLDGGVWNMFGSFLVEFGRLSGSCLGHV